MTMPQSLFSVANKNVLITGGSRGIGLMIAKGFIQAGANVLLTSRSELACKEAATSLHCKYVVSNCSTRQGCEELASYTKNHFGNKLHVLVNNAGCSWGEEPYYQEERVAGRTNWGWDKVMDLNVKGVFYLTRACVPMMANAQDSIDGPGRIINIGSVAGYIPQEAPTHAYDVSKAAVHHLTKKMASDLASKNITVNCVAPGFVETKMSQGLGKWISVSSDKEKSNENALDTLANKIPLGRLGEEDDMIGACIYLSSKAGSWVTGVTIAVDGGTVGAIQIPLSSL